MFSTALLIFSFFSAAFATVVLTEPVASTTYSGGKGGAVVTWMDNGTAPLVSAFGPSTISIYVGNAIQQTSLQLLSTVDLASVSTITFTPDATIGPNGNDYFIRIESVSGKDSTGTPFEAFSAKFTLDSMSGTFNASVSAEIAGQSTAPLASQSSSSGTTSPSSTPSITTSSGSSKRPTGTSTTTSSTASASSGAMSLKAGWAGIAFGAVIGAMF
jgi:hypothetical protein